MVGRREKGYQRAAVDAFLSRARQAFEDEAEGIGAADVRAASFPLVRGGYEISAVDAALARVEEAFAQRERARPSRAKELPPGSAVPAPRRRRSWIT